MLLRVLKYTCLSFGLLITSCAPSLELPQTSIPAPQAVQEVQVPGADRLINMFKRAKAAASPEGDSVTLQVAAVGDGASIDTGEGIMFLSVSWMQSFDDMQSMLVIGHELAHMKGTVQNAGTDQAVESAADLEGIKLMYKMGYTLDQLRQASTLFLHQKLSPDAGSDSHPAGKDRYGKLIAYINNELKQNYREAA